MPEIFVVNLDRSPDRLERFLKRNKHLGKVVRFRALDGSQLDREALVREGYIDPGLKYKAGALGSSLSQVKLWEMAASEEKNITIFEDDAVTSGNFIDKSGDILSELPFDWDIILWGAALNPLYVWVDFGISKARLEGYGIRRYLGPAGWEEFQEETVTPSPIKLLHSFGLYGYSISAKGARAALKHCLPLRDRLISFDGTGVVTPDLGLDVAMCGLYPKIKAFLSLPNLVIEARDEESVRVRIDAENPGEIPPG